MQNYWKRKRILQKFTEEVLEYYESNLEQLKSEEYSATYKYYFKAKKDPYKLGESITFEVDYDNNICSKKSYSLLSEQSGENPNSICIIYKDENNNNYCCDNKNYEFFSCDYGIASENTFYDCEKYLPGKLGSIGSFGSLSHFSSNLKYYPYVFANRYDLYSPDYPIPYDEYFIYCSSQGNFKIEINYGEQNTIGIFKDYRIVYCEVTVERENGSVGKEYTEIVYKDITYPIPNV